jgi:hypothetical protein
MDSITATECSTSGPFDAVQASLGSDTLEVGSEAFGTNRGRQTSNLPVGRAITSFPPRFLPTSSPTYTAQIRSRIGNNIFVRVEHLSFDEALRTAAIWVIGGWRVELLPEGIE